MGTWYGTPPRALPKTDLRMSPNTGDHEQDRVNEVKSAVQKGTSVNKPPRYGRNNNVQRMQSHPKGVPVDETDVEHPEKT